MTLKLKAGWTESDNVLSRNDGHGLNFLLLEGGQVASFGNSDDLHTALDQGGFFQSVEEAYEWCLDDSPWEEA